MVSKRDLQREWREPAQPTLAEAIEAQPPPPCEEFNCPKQHTCAVNGWACNAFAEYVSKGKVRKPDLSDPAERPNAEVFYGRLELRRLPRSQEKTAV